jgi:hypothetical protein
MVRSVLNDSLSRKRNESANCHLSPAVGTVGHELGNAFKYDVRPHFGNASLVGRCPSDRSRSTDYRKSGRFFIRKLRIHNDDSSMNPSATKSKYLLRIVVIDRRNSAKPEQSTHEVSIIQDSKKIFVFVADWRFPVPAIRRRYYWGRREFAVEECGRIVGRDLFQFTGILMR